MAPGNMNWNASKALAGDKTVGRLVKWLRILGIETELIEARSLENIPPDKILLTRNREWAKRPQVVLLPSDLVGEQLRFVLEKLALYPRIRPFTLCIHCNIRLKDVSREEVFGLVPDYIYETQAEFRLCPSCGRIYWPGSHRQRMLKQLKAWGLSLGMIPEG